jgi:hypothetical protein
LPWLRLVTKCSPSATIVSGRDKLAGLAPGRKPCTPTGMCTPNPPLTHYSRTAWQIRRRFLMPGTPPAITQIRQPHCEGRACYDKKLSEGKTRREAPRSLKRQISDAVFARLRTDARHTGQVRDPGGQ